MGNMIAHSKTLKCLAEYDRRLRRKTLEAVMEAGVIKDLGGIIVGYVGCPREKLIDEKGHIMYHTLYQLVPLLADFVACFNQVSTDTRDFSLTFGENKLSRRETSTMPPTLCSTQAT
jgi:hypothetical protein